MRLASREMLKRGFQTETKDVISNRKAYESENVTSEGRRLHSAKFNVMVMGL